MADTEEKKMEKETAPLSATPAASTPASQPPPPPPPADVASDPEEDDLSDLDDVLDDFSTLKVDSKLPPKPSSSSSTAAAVPPAPADGSSSTSGLDQPDPADLLVDDPDAFAKVLQKEMEQLLGQGDFQKQFEDIMKEMGESVGADVPGGASGPSASGATSSSTAKSATAGDATPKGGEASFQESIRKTMERMQESHTTASAAASSSQSASDDILAQMLKEMESGGFGGDGSDEDFSKVLMGMMEQLTNKDILYEPMKELHDKFPKWMEDNKGKVGGEDLKRYEEQQSLVKEITERFERKGYSDDNAGDREYIVERMQKMQAAGSPPPDLVGDMNAAQEALQDIDQGCPTQ